jgi:group II intron reverse transcriptase/maturase
MNNHKDSKWAPKENINQYKGISGLPKGSNSYGSRVSHSTRYYVLSNIRRRGRATGFIKFNIRFYCSVQNDKVTSKLNKIAYEANKHPTTIIDRNLYNLLLEKELYVKAYNNLKSKPGNMTPGIDHQTIDGFSTYKIDSIIKSLKNESFQFKPARRIIIPKPYGGERPLTIASPIDKIVQEVIRMILVVVFEPTFTKKSHGFREGYSCHSAIKMIEEQFKSSRWIIEGDIEKCFDSIDHVVLRTILTRRIKDQKFLRLIDKALKSGYGFMGKIIKANIIGTPQGSIISPILSNIYLNEFDKFIDNLKGQFDKGDAPKRSKIYHNLATKLLRGSGDQTKRDLFKVNAYDHKDESFKRLNYVRYADDWVIGIRGSVQDAEMIKEKCASFLYNNLKLKLSPIKTKITSIREPILFLGVIFYLKHFNDIKKISRNNKTYKRRGLNYIIFEAPLERIIKKLELGGFCKNKQPIAKGLLIHNSKEQIVNTYNSVLRGILNYYSFVNNRNKLISWIRFILWKSCGYTLAIKYKLRRLTKVIQRFGKDFKGNSKISFLKVKYGRKKGPSKFLTNISPTIKGLFGEPISIATLYNLNCSNCGSTTNVEMHHVRMMKDIKSDADRIGYLMIKNQRKQIPLCRICHIKHHKNLKISRNKSGEPYDAKVSRTVREEV